MIFALTVTVLVALAGLSIDVIRAYDLYAREQRTAEAAALSGVLYMPNFYTTQYSDSKCAVSRALDEAQKNGFGNGGSRGCDPSNACTGLSSSSEITVCKITASTTAVQVTITEPMQVYLLSIVGFTTINVTATAGADFIPPFTTGLGQDPGSGDTNKWGTTGANPKNFLASINGPAEFQESGDPYVNCQEAPSLGPPADGNMLNATYPLADTSTATVAGFPTNHVPPVGFTPQCGSSNPDQQPAGFAGEATRGSAHPSAYNFAITTTGATSLWIFNPGFTPQDLKSSCNGSQTWDMFFLDDSCSQYYTQYGPLTYNGNFDDPRFYFNVTYSLYSVPSVFDRSADVLQTGFPQTYAPLDMFSSDLSLHGCGGKGAYDLSQVSSYTGVPGNGGCVNAATSYANQWINVGNIPSAGLYRLAVEATSFMPSGNPNPSCPQAFLCGWGKHSYALMVCTGGAPTSCTAPGDFISAWNNFDMYLNFPSAVKDLYVPVAYVDGAYAGRTITISLFDPGDSHGHGDNAYFTIVPPDPCITVTFPSTSSTWVRQATYGGTLYPSVAGSCAQSTNSIYATARNGGGQKPSDDIYNGLWVPMTMVLPTNFTGGEFWLDMHTDQGKCYDELAVSIAVNGGSPVHLIF
jgi:hypothetical protein